MNELTEIREALRDWFYTERESTYPGSNETADEALDSVIDAATDPLVESIESNDDVREPFTGGPGRGALWGDLRPSEAKELAELVRDAKARAADQCKRIILEEVTAAAVAFAERHPDAKRAEVAQPV